MELKIWPREQSWRIFRWVVAIALACGAALGSWLMIRAFEYSDFSLEAAGIQAGGTLIAIVLAIAVPMIDRTIETAKEKHRDRIIFQIYANRWASSIRDVAIKIGELNDELRNEISLQVPYVTKTIPVPDFIESNIDHLTHIPWEIAVLVADALSELDEFNRRPLTLNDDDQLDYMRGRYSIISDRLWKALKLIRKDKGIYDRIIGPLLWLSEIRKRQND
ncbi:MAG TPA: hypothetical protein VHL08_00810 [Dongiaceae bacterium]|nr:hypothetical protein [Dongiaceae bacterium]